MNRMLLDALRTHPSPYHAELPYNLNWALQPDGETASYLDKNPIVVVDVGSRDGPIPELATLYEYICYLGFDADASATQIDEESSRTFKSATTLPYFVSPSKGLVTFNLFRQRAESSVYPPNSRYQSVFRGATFDIEKEVEVVSRPLDDAILEAGIAAPDFLKLDTQGSELAILRSSQSAVSSASLIEVEVEFTELYEGQPLFQHVAEFLGHAGFELLYLNRVFGQRAASYQGFSRGQLLYGDALYARREDRLAEVEAAKLVKFALLLINYGHIDFAYQLVTKFPVIAEELPDIMRFFENPFSKNIAYRIRRRLAPFLRPRLDKLICLLLHLRKHNQLVWDSDRSWPTR